MSDSILEKIHAAKARLNIQDIPGRFPNNPLPEPFKPDQKEMDKLASALTEAVLQLRAGDMDGARKTLSDADRLCGVRLSAGTIRPPGYFLDAVRYEVGMSKQYMTPQPDRAMTATEIQQRQRIAELQLRSLQNEMVENMNTTLSHIIKDPGA